MSTPSGQVNASLLIFFSVVIGSASFMAKNEYGEFLVVGFVILFALLMNYKIRRKTDDKFPGDIMCGWFWLGWITYGYLFRDITVSLESSHVLTAFVVFLVILSYTRYVKENVLVMDSLLFVVLFLLLMPTEDNVFIRMNPALYSFKIGFFIFLYVFSDADIWNNDDLEYQKMKNVKIIRSTWVLYASRVFLIGVVVQIIFLFYAFKKALLEKDESTLIDTYQEEDNYYVNEKNNNGDQNGNGKEREKKPVVNIVIEDVRSPLDERREHPQNQVQSQSQTQSQPQLRQNLIPPFESTNANANANANANTNTIDSESFSYATSVQSQSDTTKKGSRKTKKKHDIQSDPRGGQLLKLLINSHHTE